MDVEKYLNRIKYRGALEPTSDVLRALHEAHLMSVPFENLNIAHGVPVVLDKAALYAKVVDRNRGGFCYELNGLFSDLLIALGFNVTLLSAGVYHANGKTFGPEFDHLTLLVQLEERWLADVGFGVGFRHPLLLDSRDEQPQANDSYKLEQEDAFVLLTRCQPGEDWRPAYRFQVIPRRFEEFQSMCVFHSTSKESPFSKHTLVMMDSPDGRIEIMDTTYTLTRSNGEKVERHLDRESYHRVMQDKFGIDTKSIKSGSSA